MTQRSAQSSLPVCRSAVAVTHAGNMCLTLLASQLLTPSRRRLAALTSVEVGRQPARQVWSKSVQPGGRNRIKQLTRAGVLPQSATLATLSATQLPPMLQHLASPASLVLTVLGVFAFYAWSQARKHSKRSDLILQRTSFNQGVLSRCPTINSVYQTWPLLSNGHVETIFASKLRRNPPVSYTRKSFKTPDGGTVHIDYHNLPSTIVRLMHASPFA